MEQLINLIQVLSPAEKKQYVKFARQHLSKKDSQKVFLFQLINQQLSGQIKDYEVKALEQIPAKSLPSIKTQLYQHILFGLSQNTQPSIRNRLSQMVDEVQILVDRGLLKQAMSRILKARKLAEQHHLHFITLELSLLYRRIIRQYKTQDVIELIQEEQVSCQDKIELIQEEFNLLASFEGQFIRRRQKDDLAPLGAQWNTWQVDQLQSFEGKVYYHLLLQLQHNNKRDYQKAFAASEQLLELFESQPALLQEKMPRYLRLVTNYLNACLRTQRFDQFWEKLEEVRQLKTNNFYAEAQKQLLIVGQEVLLRFYNREYHQIAFQAKSIQKVLDKYKVFIPYERAIGIAYNVGVTFFLIQQLDTALDWINRCLETQDRSELKEKVSGKQIGIFVQGSAMVFRLILFYELGHHHLARNFLPSTLYFMQKHSLDPSTLYEIASALKQLLKRPEEKEVLLRHLQSRLDENPQFEEYGLWIERTLPSADPK